MNWLSYILALALGGLVVGGLARLIVPGRDSLGIFGTILAGLGGAFIGGLIAYYLLGSTNFWLNLALAVGAAVLFVIPFRIFFVTPTVIEGAPVRRGFWGSRVDDYGYPRPFWSRRAVDADYGYDRRPFWGRRRGLF